MATTKRPSPVTKNVALAVLALGIPRNVARASIVVASGVSTSSIGQGVLGLRRGLRDLGDLLVLGVPAGVAEDQGVLAVVVEDHELVGPGPAHDPDVGADGDRVEPESLEDPLVGAVLLPIAHVEPGVVEVAAVGVLHDELADADEAAARAWLVPELRLEVVELHRELPVALDDVAQEEGDDLLVGHGQDHVPVAAVLEPHELRPDLVVATAVLPHLGGVDDGHLELLAADRVHLLADDLLDSLGHPEPEREQRIDPGSELAHVPGAQQQAMGRHLRLGRVVAERGEEQLREAHGAKDTGRPSADAATPRPDRTLTIPPDSGYPRRRGRRS